MSEALHRRAVARKTLVLCKGNERYLFRYPPGLESAALDAVLHCPGVGPVEALALACYLGIDPKGLDLPGA